MAEPFATRLKMALKQEWKKLYFPEPEESGCSLEQMLPALMSFQDDRSYAREYLFPRDPIAGAIDPGQADDLCRRALACGQEQARKIKAAWPVDPVRSYCQANGICVEKDADPGVKGYYRFGEYLEPDQIRLNGACVDRAAQLTLPEGCNLSLRPERVEEVLTAHELYHHLEHRDPQIFTASYRHTQGRSALFGPAKLLSLGEIGASAFVAELMEDSFLPLVYDVVFTYCFDPKAASALCRSICTKLQIPIP